MTSAGFAFCVFVVLLIATKFMRSNKQTQLDWFNSMFTMQLLIMLGLACFGWAPFVKPMSNCVH